MRILLDTQVLLWALNGQRQPSTQAQEAIRSAEAIFVSVISYAEIGIKASVGKLHVPRRLPDVVNTYGARTLTLAPSHGLRVAELPLHHRDPFDRLLIAQAMEEDLAIISSDAMFAHYRVHVVPAV